MHHLLFSSLTVLRHFILIRWLRKSISLSDITNRWRKHTHFHDEDICAPHTHLLRIKFTPLLYSLPFISFSMILLLSFLFLLLFSLFSFFLYYRCPMIQLWLVFTELPDRQTQPNNIEDNNELIHVTQITHSTYMISCHIVILVTKQNFWFCEFESLIYMLSVSCPMIIKFNNLSIHCKGFIHVLKTLFTNLWWTHDKST